MAALLTLAQMAERLSVSPKTLKKYATIADGIPHVCIGRNMRFRPDEVEAHLVASRASETAMRSNVRVFPVVKKRRQKSVISIKFAEAR